MDRRKFSYVRERQFSSDLWLGWLCLFGTHSSAFFFLSSSRILRCVSWIVIDAIHFWNIPTSILMPNSTSRVLPHSEQSLSKIRLRFCRAVTLTPIGQSSERNYLSQSAIIAFYQPCQCQGKICLSCADIWQGGKDWQSLWVARSSVNSTTIIDRIPMYWHYRQRSIPFLDLSMREIFHRIRRRVPFKMALRKTRSDGGHWALAQKI